jgi:hypothetical protein
MAYTPSTNYIHIDYILHCTHCTYYVYIIHFVSTFISLALAAWYKVGNGDKGIFSFFFTENLKVRNEIHGNSGLNIGVKNVRNAARSETVTFMNFHKICLSIANNHIGCTANFMRSCEKEKSTKN